MRPQQKVLRALFFRTSITFLLTLSLEVLLLQFLIGGE
jgi:hypothetical protein